MVTAGIESQRQINERANTSCKELAIVIVNYRRYDLLEKCLEAIHAQNLSEFEVSIVDNESDSNQLEAIRRRYPDTTIIGNVENRGFAVACNQAFEYTNSIYTLFLNPDVIVNEETLVTTLEAIRQQDGIGAVTCKLLLPSGEMDHACHRGFPTPWASFSYLMKLHRVFPRSKRCGRYTLSWLDTDEAHEVEACSGAYLLIRTDLFRELGGWNEAFWFYGEDLDLCLRISKAGYSLLYTPAATAVHIKSASSYVRRQWDSLTAEEASIRYRSKREAIRSHALFFELHDASSSHPILRFLVRSSLLLQVFMLNARFWFYRRASARRMLTRG